MNISLAFVQQAEIVHRCQRTLVHRPEGFFATLQRTFIQRLRLRQLALEFVQHAELVQARFVHRRHAKASQLSRRRRGLLSAF